MTGVTTDHLVHVWPHVEPLIEMALAPNETLGYVLTRLYNKHMQLWIAYEGSTLEAAMTTEILNEPDRKICNIAHVGGRGLNNWMAYFPMVEAWAREQGCGAIRIARGRPGWKRLLPDFKTSYVTLEKGL